MRTRTPSQDRVRSLQAGESFIHPRTDPKFVFYVSHYAKRCGKRFKTRATESGRRVERLV